MDLKVYAGILGPAQPGDPYLVMASAFPSRPGAVLPKSIGRNTTADSEEEAKAKCHELANELREQLQSAGHRVFDMHCGSCCGTEDREFPACRVTPIP